MAVYKLRAYWKPRKETIESCADRLFRFLTALAGCDGVFSRWFKLGMSPRKALKSEIDFKNKTCLLDLLDKGRHRKDVGREVMEDLGFSVGMWNGGTPTKAVALSVSCGSYWIGPSASGGNSVVIDLPEELGDLRRSECMENVLVVAAKCWEPDWVRVSLAQLAKVEDVVPGKPIEGPKYFDWMLYVSNKLMPNPKVPEPSLVKPVDALGSLIVVQQEPVEAENPVHLQRVKAVEVALGMTS
jgi:hypothetical protein